MDATAEALYPLLAQSQGLGLGGVSLVVHACAPRSWRLARRSVPLASVEEAIELDFERQVWGVCVHAVMGSMHACSDGKNACMQVWEACMHVVMGRMRACSDGKNARMY
jgi:hypothetical protein